MQYNKVVVYFIQEKKMIAKYWKKIGLLILIICCLFNIVSKVVKRTTFKEQLMQTAQYVLNNNEKQIKSLEKRINICQNIKQYFLLEIKKEVNNIMKEGLHPEFKEATITCACGNVMETKSTKKDIKVDVCSKCHPYWTGNLKQNTTGGRADKFKKKYGIQ